MRKIAVATGSRAEYGLLKPLIRAIHEDSQLELQLYVTAMHLMPEFGLTYQEIERDGFPIMAKVEDGLSGDSSAEITRSLGQCIIGFAEVFNSQKPDLLIILGDRTEMLGVASAAVLSLIPIAHIHGGETTEGAYDEYFRHAISKMSYLHFTSTEAYRKRVIQLGEGPDRVFNVGAIGIDSIRSLKLMDKTTFEDSIGGKLLKRLAMITFHPVTLENASAGEQFSSLLQELDRLEETTLIFTKANSDKDGRVINQMIDDYVKKNDQKAMAFASLGQLRYLSALQFADFVIGNSSSGVLEVPYFEKPTINIGDRQKGRIMPKSVINCKPDQASIRQALLKASSAEFLESIQDQEALYGQGDSTGKIMEQLKNANIKQIKKPFFDLNPTCFEEL